MTVDINEFLNYLSLELNYSGLTVQAYGRNLERWVKWVMEFSGQAPDCSTVTTKDLRLYVAHLSSQGLRQRSVRCHVQALRAFFKYLMRQKGLPSNPADDLVLAKVEKLLPVYAREEETQALVGQAADADDWVQARDHLILDILYSTGVRVSELCSMTNATANLSTREMKIMGKRRKERIIPFGPELAGAILHYISLRDQQWGKTTNPQGPLLVSNKGVAINRNQVYRLVHNAMEMAGVHAQRLSPHVLRHCCATDMLRHGAGLMSVKTMLGHSALSSTQIYTHLSFAEIKEAYNHAHPRGGGRCEN